MDQTHQVVPASARFPARVLLAVQWGPRVTFLGPRTWTWLSQATSQPTGSRQRVEPFPGLGFSGLRQQVSCSRWQLW